MYAWILAVVQEIGELRATIQSEMDTLKTDFLELKGSLYEQLRVTAELAEVVRDAKSAFSAKECIALTLTELGGKCALMWQRGCVPLAAFGSLFPVANHSNGGRV